jgi:tetratricopeptide (TPR) repeat protein
MIGVVYALVMAAPAVAQEPAAAPAGAPAPQPRSIPEVVKSAQETKFTPPTCDIDDGHFKVKSGRTYLKSAIESPSNRDRILNDAERVLRESIAKDGQGSVAGSWYWLGRVALYKGDIATADSALDKAESLAPACKADIDLARRPTWAGLTQAGIELYNAKKPAEAEPYLVAAASFYDAEPQAFSALGNIALDRNDRAMAQEMFRKAYTAATTPEQQSSRAASAAQVGSIFAAEGKYDSAMVYLGEAVAKADTLNQRPLLRQSLFNLALMEQRAGKNEDAVRHMNQAVAMDPSDTDARRGLAQMLRSAGMADSARKVEESLLTSAGGDPAAGGVGEMSASALLDLGVAAFREKDYKRAADAFEKALVADPQNHDALFNLANSYLGMSAWDKLGATAGKLLALEPYNEFANKAAVKAHQQLKHADASNAAATKLLEMPVAIEASNFASDGRSANWQATATGRDAMTAAGAAKPAAAFTLVVEFLDAKGGVVAAQDVAVNALKAGETQALAARVDGAGIASWRYRAKS